MKPIWIKIKTELNWKSPTVELQEEYDSCPAHSEIIGVRDFLINTMQYFIWISSFQTLKNSYIDMVKLAYTAAAAAVYIFV